MMSFGRRRRSAIPGFGLTMGLTLSWLGLIVLIPLSMIVWRASGMGWEAFADIGLSPRAMAAYRLSFGAALAAALVNMGFGLLIAWVLVRYDFPGKRFVDAAVDLPFALPTAVAGIALVALYADNGWIGGLLAPLGIRVAYTPVGVAIALVFIGLPFVVRSVQPVLADLGHDVEEAAATLGATRLQTFVRVIFPAVFPALLSGFALAFARGIGEYGSIIFIAGNMPFRSEIAPLLIITRLEQFDYDGATAIACVMLALSLAMLLVVNLIQAWRAKRGTR